MDLDKETDKVIVSRDAKFLEKMNKVVNLEPKEEQVVFEFGMSQETEEIIDILQQPLAEVSLDELNDSQNDFLDATSGSLSNHILVSELQEESSEDGEEEPETNAEENEQTVNPVRKSKRSNLGVPPKHLDSYVRLVMKANQEPRNFRESMNCPEKDDWMKAMNSEIESLKENGTWTLVKLPQGRKAVGSKWVYKLKHNASDGSYIYKARLVAQGYSQKYGIDYEEVFAPVKQVTFRTMITIASLRNLRMENFDIKTAFLNGDLEEEIFMRQPCGFEAKGSEDLVCKLGKSIYGLKQSARMWNKKFDSVLIENNYQRSKIDNCLYMKSGSNGWSYILLYVDDFIVASSSDHEIRAVEKFLSQHFKVKS
jgi:hypothetical protein